MNKMQNSGGQELAKVETELQSCKEENEKLKREIAQLKEQLNYEKDKLSSLELTLQSLTAGKEEMITREKAAAEERAQVQRAREEQFNAQLQLIESKGKETEMKLKSELNLIRNEGMKREQELTNTLENTKKTKDREIEGLRKLETLLERRSV